MKTHCASLAACVSLWAMLGVHAQVPMGVWTFKHVDWVYAPKEIGYRERTGEAGNIRLYPDGSMLLVYDAVIEQPPGKNPVMSQGDGWTIYRGKWKTEGEFIRLTFKLVYADIRRVRPDGSEVCPTGEQTEFIRPRNGEFSFQGSRFKFESRLLKSFDRTFELKNIATVPDCANRP